MTAKEYLEQARFLDLRINAKLEEVEGLNALATKVTSVYSDMPGSPNRDTAKMAKTIEKIVDLEKEINRDIEALVDLKRDISNVIKQVQNQEYQYILEQKYLHFAKWEEIAVKMNYAVRWIYKMHGTALKKIEDILKEFTKIH